MITWIPPCTVSYTNLDVYKRQSFFSAAPSRRENLFETLPEDRKTAEVCRFAIKKSAFNIEFVPEAMKTPELCLAAAGHRGETLKFVPDRLKTPTHSYKE